jgi:hypothetical protein
MQFDFQTVLSRIQFGDDNKHDNTVKILSLDDAAGDFAG